MYPAMSFSDLNFLVVEYFIYLTVYNILSNLQLYSLYLMGSSVKSRGEITRATNLYPKNIKNTDPLLWKTVKIWHYTNWEFNSNLYQLYFQSHMLQSLGNSSCYIYTSLCSLLLSPLMWNHSFLTPSPSSFSSATLEKLETLTMNPQWAHQVG